MMVSVPKELWFFIPLAAIVTAPAILRPSLTGYAGIALLAVVSFLFLYSRTWRNRGFILICSSVPLIVSCAIQDIRVGAGAACLLGGIVSSVLGLLDTRGDLPSFGLFCGTVGLVALLVAFSNHVIAPLIIIAGIASLVLFIQSVRNYQFRKEYSGAGP
jgi:hypothetical protein